MNGHSYHVILNVHICPECGDQFSNNEDLENHFLSTHEENGLEIARVSNNINNHILSKRESYTCIQCGGQFLSEKRD